MNKLVFTIPKAYVEVLTNGDIKLKYITGNNWATTHWSKRNKMMESWVGVVKKILELQGFIFKPAKKRKIGGSLKGCWKCAQRFTRPVKTNYLFFYGDNIDRDLDNDWTTMKITNDALVRLGIIEDDCVPFISKDELEYAGRVVGQEHIVEVTLSMYRRRWAGKLEDRRLLSEEE